MSSIAVGIRTSAPQSQLRASVLRAHEHARSVVACALDVKSGLLIRQRLTPDLGDLQRWLAALPAPVMALI